MPKWGRGWEVGINKAISEHERVTQRAAEIVTAEHGRCHQPGERINLCMVCQSDAEKARASAPQGDTPQ